MFKDWTRRPESWDGRKGKEGGHYCHSPLIPLPALALIPSYPWALWTNHKMKQRLHKWAEDSPVDTTPRNSSCVVCLTPLRLLLPLSFARMHILPQGLRLWGGCLCLQGITCTSILFHRFQLLKDKASLTHKSLFQCWKGFKNTILLGYDIISQAYMPVFTSLLLENSVRKPLSRTQLGVIDSLSLL